MPITGNPEMANVQSHMVFYCFFDLKLLSYNLYIYIYLMHGRKLETPEVPLQQGYILLSQKLYSHQFR